MSSVKLHTAEFILLSRTYKRLYQQSQLSLVRCGIPRYWILTHIALQKL
jgi:hypothetical protein